MVNRRLLEGSMKTLGMMSIIFVTIAAPAIAARHPDSYRGFRRMLLLIVAFTVLWVAYLTQVHVNVFVPQR